MKLYMVQAYDYGDNISIGPVDRMRQVGTSRSVWTSKKAAATEYKSTREFLESQKTRFRIQLKKVTTPETMLTKHWAQYLETGAIDDIEMETLESSKQLEYQDAA